MIYNESGNIVMIFESEKFEFSKNSGSKNINDLESRAKQEINELLKITSKFKDENLNLDYRIINLKKRVKCLNAIQKISQIIPLASLLVPATMGIINKANIASFIVALGGVGLGVSGYCLSSNQSKKDSDEIIKLYEDNINASIKILNQLDKINLKNEDKLKVKNQLEKIRNISDDINELKNAFKNEQKIADQMDDKYHLYDKFMEIGSDLAACVGVVLSYYNDDKYTYINAVVGGYSFGDMSNSELGLEVSGAPNIKVIKYKRLSDNWDSADCFKNSTYKSNYLVIKCEKTDYKFKKGQIFIRNT